MACDFVSKGHFCYVKILLKLNIFRCQQESGGSPGSVVSGTGVSTAGRTEWQVVAHEIGHNFGAIVSDLRHNFSSTIFFLMIAIAIRYLQHDVSGYINRVWL